MERRESHTLVGVVSHGNLPCAQVGKVDLVDPYIFLPPHQRGEYGVYTEVASYIRWIRDTLQRHGGDMLCG